MSKRCCDGNKWRWSIFALGAVVFLALGSPADAGIERRRAPTGWEPEAPPKTEREQGQDAVQGAEKFMRICGIPVPTAPPQTSNRGKNLFLVFYAGGPSLIVDAGTGEVTHCSNVNAPPPGQDARRSREAAIPDRLSAQVAARHLLNRLGIGRDLPLSRLEWSADSDQRRVTATFEPMPDGHRLEPGFGKVELQLDPSSGSVLVFGKKPARPYVLQSRKARLKLEDAEALAKPLAARYRLGSRRVAPKNRSELVFVRPNGEMGGLKVDFAESPTRLRLAWVIVYPGDEEVWIDAADGKLLGGVWHAGPQFK